MDTDYPTRWRLNKARFSRAIEPTERLAKRRIEKGERGIWQRRYWEHVIRDEGDLNRHVGMWRLESFCLIGQRPRRFGT